MLTLSQLRTPIARNDALDSVLAVLKSLGFATGSWQSGSVQRTLVEGTAEVWSALSQGVAALADMAFNETSTGSFLSAFSRSHYANLRVGAVHTEGLVVLTGGAVGPPHTVTAGQLIAADPVTGYTYRNIAGGTVPASGTLTLTFRAEVAGAARNIANGALTVLKTPLAGVAISNPDPGSGTWITTQGLDEESDERLRLRNSSRWATLAYATPADGYVHLALAADTDVTRVLVDDSNPRGPGTLDVYIARATGVASGSDETTVQAYINTRRPVSADPLVIAAPASAQPVAGTVHITAALNTPAKHAEIAAAIDTYINSLPIGGEVIPGVPLPPGTSGFLVHSELVGAMTDVEGVRRVALTTPTADVAIVSFTLATPGTKTLTFVSI